MPVQTFDDNPSPLPKLSARATILWGKSGDKDSDLWLPLYVHLADAIEIAKILWDEWVPPATKRAIARGIRRSAADSNADESEEQSIEIAKKVFILLLAFHDIGKATPIFQVGLNSYFKRNNADQLANDVRRAGLAFPDRINKQDIIHHSLSSFAILERHGWNSSFSAIAGAHHGKPPSATDIQAVRAAVGKEYTGFDNDGWLSVQDEFVAWAEQAVEPEALEQIKKCKLSKQAQVLLTGLVIIADWIASDEQRFSLIQVRMRAGSSVERARNAWENLDLIPYQELPAISSPDDIDKSYKTRFSLDSPRPLQRVVAELLAKTRDLGIVIIEAPMGEGKTEIALVLMEILAKSTGRSGVFFALPTQATSDGIFERILTWVQTFKGARSIVLAHGKAHFHELFKGLRLASKNVNDGEDAVFVSDWAHGRKRAILSDFVVGTIDQVLMGGLKQKHLMLRHLGLANKIVILDECHAYDAYMSQYLYKVLNWLGSYQVPVIVLSATLPADRRQELVEAYLNIAPKAFFDDPLIAASQIEDKRPEWACASEYPLVTYSSGDQVLNIAPPASARRLDVKISRLDEQDIVPLLIKSLEEGGCVGIIVNTVTTAQRLAHVLSEVFGDGVVVLLHSRFIAPDRVSREKNLRDQLGPRSTNRPKKLIVVGTQVLEQSLDIDFDMLITEICPMDLLIQRLGRLHRHEGRNRSPLLSEPRCYVMGIEGDACFDKGSELVYGLYLLMNTQALLPEHIILPDDISPLVQSAYAPDGVIVPSDVQDTYRKAKSKHEQKIEDARAKAETFQIGNPAGGSYETSATIIDWLNTSVSDDPKGKHAEATVRDTADSIQILVIQKKRDGRFYSLLGAEAFGEQQLPDDFAQNERLAQAVASCVVTLPMSMSTPWRIDSVIEALEKDCCEQLPDAWQQSAWLRDELFLILDEDMHTRILDFELNYDQNYGLLVERTVVDE
jgi:CRISPR-associated endonuclease/helicase Cas3